MLSSRADVHFILLRSNINVHTSDTVFKLFQFLFKNEVFFIDGELDFCVGGV